MDRLTVCDVVLDPRKGGQDAVWTYRPISELQVGDAVFVPLGMRSELGFVLRIYTVTEDELPFPIKSLRSVSARVDGLTLPGPLIDLIRFVSENYLCSLANAAIPALPPGVSKTIRTVWSIVPGAILREGAPAVPSEVFRVMKESDGVLEVRPGKKPSPAMINGLKALRKMGLVEHKLQVAPVQERPKANPVFRLTQNAAKVETFLQRESKKRPAQALTVMAMQSADRGLLTAAEIKALAAVTESTLKALIQAGLLEEVDPEHSQDGGSPPTPNRAQQLAIDAIVESVNAGEPQPFLLFGVTGSGKTEVFLRSAREALRKGKQVLYLVPEIALAAQSIGLLRRRFGSSVAILHSNLTDSERLSNWLRVRDGRASIILGARSALFAPLSNLGLIIVDEEHEQSYKQESVPRYHVKPLALRLAARHSCPVVFGSATPSVESFYEADENEARVKVANRPSMVLLTLPERTASSKLPAVTIRDLGEGYRNHQPDIMTEELRKRIKETLEQRHQVILFLNRRAYAPFLMCRDCGHTLECPNCSVSLSFHRGDAMLRCHHCGYQTKPISQCPKCLGVRVNPFGAGTERVEEAVAKAFPYARVGRLDRDIARKKGALEQILCSFRSGDLDILVGTQIVAKGLDFPNVTLVGVIAADVSLNLPDFRASERTFQLLSQVAGRAGRGTAPGTVVVQTFNPEHAAVLAAKEHAYLPMYDTLREERKAADYPPFTRLVNLILTGEDEQAVVAATDLVAALVAQECPDATVLGPVNCALERVMGKWRRHVLVKIPPYTSASPIGRALQPFDVPGVQLAIDVDPYSMM